MKKLILLFAIATGILNAQVTILPGKNGGTGVSNTGKTITLGGSFITTGTSTPTLAFPPTSYTFTLPGYSGTLATLAGSEAFTNKTGNISMWTNDVPYLTSATLTSMVSSSANYNARVAVQSSGNPNAKLQTDENWSGNGWSSLIRTDTNQIYLYNDFSTPFKGLVYASDYSGTYLAYPRAIADIGTNDARYAPIAATFTVNGTGMALGTSSTVTAAAGTLTGTALNSTVVTSSLTTLGAVSTGTYNATIGTASVTLGSDATGDIYYRASTGALTRLADAATGNALISGGAGAAPSYGKISLTTHVSGTTPVGNGGTGVTTFGGTNLILYTTAAGTLTSNANLTYDGTTFTAASLNTRINQFGFGAGHATNTIPTINHPFMAQIATNGRVDLNIFNSQAGTAASAAVTLSSNTSNLILQQHSGSYTTSGAFIANGALLYTDGAGGISFAAAHASGVINLYTAGTASTNLAVTIDANKKVDMKSGVLPNGGGFKHQRVTTGSVGAGSTALITITWSTAFADANYTVQASVEDATTSSLSLSVVHVESVAAGSVTVRVLNNAIGSLTGTVHVIAIHD